MLHMNSFTGRLTAAVSAVVLSFVLFGGTVSNPAQAKTAQVVSAQAAYVGVIA